MIEMENCSDIKREKFTVRCKSKSECIEEDKRASVEKPSICLSIFKWIFTICMFFITLLCLILSKLCFVSISQQLGNGTFRKGLLSKEHNEGKNEDFKSDVAFTMILLLMLIPNLISFIRSFAKSAFSTVEVWPSSKSIVWGIVAAFLETLGLCLFSLVVINAMENFIQSLFLMNGIFIFPVFYQTIREIRKVIKSKSAPSSINDHPYIQYRSVPVTGGPTKVKYSCLTLFRFFLSTLLAFGGFGFLIFLATSTFERVMIPLSMLCLSIAWSPKILKLLTEPVSVNPSDQQRLSGDTPATNFTVKSVRNRVTLITSAVKFLLTFLFAFCLNYFLKVGDEANPWLSFYNGLKYFSKNEVLMSLFFIQVTCSLIAYLLCWLACTINLQKICFVLPLLLSTPAAAAVVYNVEPICSFFHLTCPETKTWIWWETGLLGLFMWLSQVISLNVEFYKSQQFLMAKEDYLFWLPTYDGLLLEQHLLLNRKNEITDETYVNYHQIVKNSHIYICTTMYREADYEMEQLLQSLARIDEARKECKREFEAHIWFDDGARGDVIKLYALQLLSLVKGAMKIEPGKAFKLETPYGLQLKWILPHGMPFILHLKDKVKVKNKKRWSQVMYMSYILDFKEKKYDDDLTFILATDADVKFTPKDVMALMDFMSRNPQVASVCGRTYPMGSGPLVWYQMFDYAIGHWLLKVANHVFGSVLCSPGCFSVYRAKAIRDVLPQYATGVSTAMDFLMKDMGEDRWLCTLLVEAGWSLEYCATACDSTYCPEEFDEFFKQRRRWGPSTLANSIVVLNNQKVIRENNDAINILFIAYQFILMVSTIIGALLYFGDMLVLIELISLTRNFVVHLYVRVHLYVHRRPSTVLLVVAGGLQYAYPEAVNFVVVLVILVVITTSFTLICLYCTQEKQLKVAKLLTCVFAVVMTLTTVGLIKQSVDNVNSYVHPPTVAPTTHRPLITTSKPITTIVAVTTSKVRVRRLVDTIDVKVTTKPPSSTLHPEPTRPPFITALSPATLYLFFIITIFILTALLHGREATNLVHGVWYLLCLPSGYLLLTIYSFANLTDRSWGTREGKTHSSESNSSFGEFITGYLKYIFWCCVPPHLREKKENKEEEENVDLKDSLSDTESSVHDNDETDLLLDEKDGRDEEKIERAVEVDANSSRAKISRRRPHSVTSLSIKKKQSSFRFPGQKKVAFVPVKAVLQSAMSVDEWLPNEYKHYAELFREHGFDDVSFIAGFIKEKDLQDIGISNRGHRKRLLVAIESLPPEEFFQEVPDDVEEWLLRLGLDQYWPMFHENSYTEPRDLADIKYMGHETISSIFKISKIAHLEKLIKATASLQYPTKAQKLIRDARKAVMAEPTKSLKAHNGDDGEEYDFWTELREICLLPEQAAFNQSGELVEKLSDMRDSCMLVLAIANILWLTFMVAVMGQESLNVLGTSFASVAFLFVYTFVLILQFISLLWHRFETLIHFIARAPFKPGHLKSNWAWRDKDLPSPVDPKVLDEIRQRQLRRSPSSNYSSDNDEEIQTTWLTEPLVARRDQQDVI